MRDNIVMYPDYEYGELKEQFRSQVEAAVDLLGEAKGSVLVYVMKYFGALLPKAQAGVSYRYYQNKRFAPDVVPAVDAFTKEMRQIEGRWGAAGNAYMTSESIKLYVFFLWPDRETIEREVFGAGEDAAGNGASNNDNDRPALNILPVEPKYRLDQMVLNQDVKDEITSCVALVRNIDKIYKEWGFEEVDAVQKTVINFYGPAGTGKTMAAHAITHELGRKILAVNYAEIESKYVGDAPKNLISAFEIAKRENAVLFFDEADSFLGKRITSVSSSSDQSVNSLRSQMLILLENFDVVVIFATNLNENYDKAFNSRILQSVKFDLPDSSLRKHAIQTLIPSKAPIDRAILTEELLDKLAAITEGFSYREMKNAVLLTLTECCVRDCGITAQLLEEVFTKKKKEFDDLKNKGDARKKELGKQVAENLKTGNYTVYKGEKDSAEDEHPQGEHPQGEHPQVEAKEEDPETRLTEAQISRALRTGNYRVVNIETGYAEDAPAASGADNNKGVSQ